MMLKFDIYYISEAILLFEHNFEIIIEINGIVWLKSQVCNQMHIFLEGVFVVTWPNIVHYYLEAGDVLVLGPKMF